jgi:uncharacterized membrane protein YeaQ/YmgE (transglycosylase-associated protein family)
MNNVLVHSARVVATGAEGMGEGEQAVSTAMHFAVMLATGVALGTYIKPRRMMTVPTKTAFLLVLSRLMIGMTGAVIAGQLAWGFEWYSRPGDWTQIASSLVGAAVLLYAYCRAMRSFTSRSEPTQLGSFAGNSRKRPRAAEV